MMPVEKRWLSFAEDDILTAKIALENKIYNQVCFHSQQAVEKLLKGFIEGCGQRAPRTHSLRDLMNICTRIDSSFCQFDSYATILDQYYIPTRYPDALPGMLDSGLPGKNDAKEALEMAQEIMDYIKSK